MTDTDALYILAAWFSPAYPVGGFSYSHGLEYALEAGILVDRASAEALVTDILQQGAGRLDAQFLAAAYRAAQAEDTAKLKDIAELAAAFAATRELALETRSQGAAFLKVTRDCWPAPPIDAFIALWPGPYAYPVVVGVAAAAHGLPLPATAAENPDGDIAFASSTLVIRRREKRSGDRNTQDSGVACRMSAIRREALPLPNGFFLLAICW